jgi:hypothetical protein
MTRPQQIERSKGVLPVLVGLTAICVGVLLAYFGYLWDMVFPNPGELLGSFFFWFAVVGLLLAYPLREASRDFARSVRTRLGAGVFAGYLAVHLVLYGFLLEAIITVKYGSSLLEFSSPGLLVTTDVFSPPSLTSALFDLSYNPSIIFTNPPVFSAALSFYSISMAFIIDVLVLANIAKTKQLGKLCSGMKRTRSFVLVPALGIVLGASCCLSVAGLVSLYMLPLTLTTELASNLLIYYVTYFFLPALAVVILYLNLHSVRRLSARVALEQLA